jgi:hypothetical protein
LSIQGSIESKKGIFDATTDENTVMFSEIQQPDFEEVKRYVDSVIYGEPIVFAELRFSEPEILVRKEAIARKILQSKQAEHNLSINLLRWLAISLPFLLWGICLVDNPRTADLGCLVLKIPLVFPIVYLIYKDKLKNRSE